MPINLDSLNFGSETDAPPTEEEQENARLAPIMSRYNKRKHTKQKEKAESAEIAESNEEVRKRVFAKSNEERANREQAKKDDEEREKKRADEAAAVEAADKDATWDQIYGGAKKSKSTEQPERKGRARKKNMGHFKPGEMPSELSDWVNNNVIGHYFADERGIPYRAFSSPQVGKDGEMTGKFLLNLLRLYHTPIDGGFISKEEPLLTDYESDVDFGDPKFKFPLMRDLPNIPINYYGGLENKDRPIASNFIDFGSINPPEDAATNLDMNFFLPEVDNSLEKRFLEAGGMLPDGSAPVERPVTPQPVSGVPEAGGEEETLDFEGDDDEDFVPEEEPKGAELPVFEKGQGMASILDMIKQRQMH